jgi:hypothetical protein
VFESIEIFTENFIVLLSLTRSPAGKVLKIQVKVCEIAFVSNGIKEKSLLTQDTLI